MRGDRTLEEFGAAYGASKQLVSNWDAGRSKPNAETLALMGIQVVYVFTPTPTNEK